MEPVNKNYLIYITGRTNHPFFLNEIDYLKSNFREIHAIAYDEESAAGGFADDGVFIYQVNHKKYGMKSGVQALKLIREEWVKAELRYINNCVSRRGLAKLYLFYYILFINKCLKYIHKIVTEIKKKDENANIYVYSFWASKGACVAAMLRKKYPELIERAVTRAHGYDLYEERNKCGYLPFRKFLAENIDDIYFISRDGMQYFEQSMKIRNVVFSKGKVVRLGTKEPGYLKTDMASCPNQKSAIVMASCSRIIEVKRLDLIIMLIKKLSEKCDVKWIHLGSGEEDYKNKIKNMAEQLISDRYVFLGEIDNKKVFDIYKEYNVDWLVNMSDSEGVPVSIMEALSCGIPAVVRDVGGNSEIVDESCGIILENIEDASLNKIVEQIIRCTQDNDLYIEKSANAHKKWESDYSAEKNTKKFARLLLNQERIG